MTAVTPEGRPRGVRIFVPTAVRAVFQSLSDAMCAEVGAHVTQIVDLNPSIPQRIRAGQDYDIALTNPPYAAALCADRFGAPESHRSFGRVPLALGVSVDACNPVARTRSDITSLLTAAQSVGYTGAGTSGRIFLDLLKRLELEDCLSKCKPMEGGQPVAEVAEGHLEMAVAPLTTILAARGVALAGVIPDDLDAHIDMSIFLHPKDDDNTLKLLNFLRSSGLDATLASAGIHRFDLT